MTAEEASRIAEAFLDDYTNGDEFFEDEQPILLLQSVGAVGGAVHVMFSIEPDRDAKDPKLVALAAKSIEALRAAHPEAGAVRVTHEIVAA